MGHSGLPPFLLHGEKKILTRTDSLSQHISGNMSEAEKTLVGCLYLIIKPRRRRHISSVKYVLKGRGILLLLTLMQTRSFRHPALD